MRDSVYIVESGDYEQRQIVLVADSEAAAIAAVRKQHEGYDVRWEEEPSRLVGHFEDQPRKAIKHTAVFDITEFHVDRAVDPSAESLWGKGCPVKVWDGPYSYRCGLGGDRGTCATHGKFADPPASG